jgi:uncharacterized protein YegP (UPF0339 family)
MSDGEFEVYESKNGWRWRQRGGNGEIMASSQAYASKSNAKRGAQTAKANAGGAPVTEKPAAKKSAGQKPAAKRADNKPASKPRRKK